MSDVERVRTRRRRQLAGAIAAVAVVGMVVVSSDAVIRRASHGAIERALGECGEIDRAGLTIPGNALALDLLRGRLHDVSFDSARADIGGLRLGQISGSVATVRVRPLAGLGGVSVEGADVTVRLVRQDVDRLLRDLGLPITARLSDDGTTLELEGLPSPVRVGLRAEGGALVVAAAPPVPMRLRLALPGADVRSARIGQDAVVLEVRATGNPRHIACRAEQALRAQLDEIAALARALPR